MQPAFREYIRRRADPRFDCLAFSGRGLSSDPKNVKGLLQNRILKNQAKEKVSQNRQGSGSG